MRIFHLVILSLLLSSFLCAQTSRKKKIKLPKELNEISGLVCWRDTLLLAINDSGNSPEVFFLTQQGRVLKRTILAQQQNVDWEDLTLDDKGNLYIADVGNNLNDRRDLSILKISAEKAFNADSVMAEKLVFSYADQYTFPPSTDDFRFNCEAIFWKNDSIFLVTKNESVIKRRSDFDRSPRIYGISDQPGNYIANQVYFSALKNFGFNRKGFSELVTGADFLNGKLILLTYKKIISIPLSDTKPSFHVLRFFRLRQREAIAFTTCGEGFVGAEYNRFLGGPFLIKLSYVGGI